VVDVADCYGVSGTWSIDSFETQTHDGLRIKESLVRKMQLTGWMARGAVRAAL